MRLFSDSCQSYNQAEVRSDSFGHTEHSPFVKINAAQDPK